MSRLSRGQAMTEFLVAMAVLVPIFFAISYLGRYGDLQQRATQASRYAAFQRAMQPSDSILSEAKIQDQLRARFFMRHDHLAADGKHLKSNDSVANVTDDTGQPALWRDLGGTALLSKPDQVKLTWASAPMGSGAYTNVPEQALNLLKKDWGGARVAQVELHLINRMDQSVPNPALLKIGAATSAGGNGLGSSGSKGTRDAVANLVPVTMVPALATNVLGLAISLFEPEGPKFGCIKPDVVATNGPTSRLVGAANNSACVQ